MESTNAKFEYENKKTAIIFDKELKNTIKHIFLVTTSIENLGFISTQLENLKKLGILEGDDWPWSVYINDLRIISEINELRLTL